jgi:hypothetical protein
MTFIHLLIYAPGDKSFKLAGKILVVLLIVSIEESKSIACSLRGLANGYELSYL